MPRKYKDEQELLQAVRQSDEEAFEYLFRSYYPRLRGYALRFVDDVETANDILQECFLHFWERRRQIESVSVTSLLFVIVRNACLNYLKHKQLVEQQPLEDISQVLGQEELYAWDFGMNPEQKLLYEELQDQIRHVLRQLPERCREVFVMSRFQHLKNREIAEKLQISSTAVEKHISKALKAFAGHFKNHYPPDAYLLLLMWLSTSP